MGKTSIQHIIWGKIRRIIDTNFFIHGKDKHWAVLTDPHCLVFMLRCGLNLISVFFSKSDQPVDHFRILTLETVHSHSNILAIVFSDG